MSSLHLLGPLEFLGFPGGSDAKVSACNAGDPGLIPGSGRSPGEGNGNPLQYSCLENSMDRGALQATVHGVSKSQTRLSDFTHSLTHSRVSINVQLSIHSSPPQPAGLSNISPQAGPQTGVPWSLYIAGFFTHPMLLKKKKKKKGKKTHTEERVQHKTMSLLQCLRLQIYWGF